MPDRFAAIPGAQGYQQSNPSVLAVASLLGSLQVIKEAGMVPALRARSVQLTAHLEARLTQSPYYVPLAQVAAKYPSEAKNTSPGFTIITSSDPETRGAQLSLLFLPAGAEVMRQVSKGLTSYGVLGDSREPDVIRLAPAPLYNSLRDCERAAAYLDEILKALNSA